MTTANLSRRVAITGMCAAVAVPANVSAQTSCSFPDLAGELAAVRKRWIAHHELCKAHSAAGKAYANAATGITEEEAREGGHESPKWVAWFGACQKYSDENRRGDPLDEHGSSITWIENFDDLYPVCRSILALPARSLVDLGVQAQALAMIHVDYYLDGMDGDSDTRQLTETLCKFCGVEPVPGLAFAPFEYDGEA